MNKIDTLAEWIKASESTVFFGGAGTSTESNVPDFRSENGLYSMNFHGIRPEEILSRDFFFMETEKFYEYLRTYLLKDDIKPHQGHQALVALEKAGLLDAIITQNIDNLHQAAGSTNVFELHGSMGSYHCVQCNAQYDYDYFKRHPEPVPKCDACGNIIKPNVVLYQEGLDQATVEGAVSAIAKADLLIVCGTSLVVYPAAGFLQYFNGKHLVLINRDETNYDKRANLVFRESFGEVFSQLMEKI